MTAMTATPPVKPKNESALEKLDRLLQKIAERTSEFEKQLDAEPQTLHCGMHGPDQRRLDRDASIQAARPVYTCPGCEQAKFEQRYLQRMEEAEIPADVRHATLENFRTDLPGVMPGRGHHTPVQFLEAARQFATGSLRNLIIAGTPGIGKGHLAAALARHEILLGRRVRWIECARLFANFHRAYQTETGDALLTRYAAPSLLILDEVCLRDLPADGEEILFAILDRRHKAGRRSILLGNKPAQETRHWLGDRISDRLRSGGVTFCYGEWPSARGSTNDGAEF
ncbi:hypothetical protein GCM10023213_04920 [Prosthecobacter algae]|uniref:IstB-like ATP-binding domain-containing protein n=1 Tax=Prosthecobacter algae TaxID=1144682 RepID=A0ABP9NUB2_9BACT